MTVDSRTNYKGVWTRLSETYKSATVHVIGDVSEDHILAAAEYTKECLEQTVGLEQADVILEIGCGIGRVGQALAPLCKEWIGCDVSPHMLEHARKRLAGFDNVRFVEISGFDLAPIASASVDLVYCTVVFMHLDEYDRYKYILEAGRVLKPGGRIFVDNFNLRSEEGWKIFDTYRNNCPPMYRPPHMGKPSTPQEIEVYLQRAGFQNINVTENDAWANGFAWKPTDGSMDAILEHEAKVNDYQLVQLAAHAENNDDSAEEILRLNQYVNELEKLVSIKNNHIMYLENLLTRIENGRVMRLLRLLDR